MKSVLGAVILAGMTLAALPVAAQESSAKSESDVAEVVVLPDPDEKIDVDAVKLPSLSFVAGSNDAANYDKYYYFHRANTAFKDALADLRDCDGLARGLTSPIGNADVPYPYAGTVSGAVASFMVAMIFGSAEIRAARRVNMRRCMYYKGYQRYGLPKEIWTQFNFEEGLKTVDEKKRQAYLIQQAKAMSGDVPRTEVLGK